jgi:hypothetical protein
MGAGKKKERVIRANLHVFRSSEWEAMMKHGMIWIMSLKKQNKKQHNPPIAILDPYGVKHSRWGLGCVSIA